MVIATVRGILYRLTTGITTTYPRMFCVRFPSEAQQESLNNTNYPLLYTSVWLTPILPANVTTPLGRRLSTTSTVFKFQEFQSNRSSSELILHPKDRCECQ